MQYLFNLFILMFRPHPKALTRVAGISNTTVLPVCPPTPTHHSRKQRCSGELRPPSLKSNDPPDLPLRTENGGGDVVDGCSGANGFSGEVPPQIGLIAMSELRNKG